MARDCFVHPEVAPDQLQAFTIELLKAVRKTFPAERKGDLPILEYQIEMFQTGNTPADLIDAQTAEIHRRYPKLIRSSTSNPQMACVLNFYYMVRVDETGGSSALFGTKKVVTTYEIIAKPEGFFEKGVDRALMSGVPEDEIRALVAVMLG